MRWDQLACVIRSFADAETEKLWQGFGSRRLPPEIQKRALAKLQLIDAAVELAFLRLPPGNRLEALRGDRSGQHSIRINDQWRISFVWNGTDAERVEITDYH
ncbi:MAG TPA: type II toxin-antitoxin system RelE/ParE family toxin [Opitutaceae bacterium]